MQIILFRHGIAEDASPHGDGGRRLTEEGIAKTGQAARGLARLIDQPDVIFTSPLIRAVQTASILADVLELEPRTLQVLASGPAENVLREIRGFKEDRIVLVGHEPTLSALGAILCAGDGARFIELKKAGAMLIDTAGQPPAPGKAELLWLATPAMLRRIAGE